MTCLQNKKEGEKRPEMNEYEHWTMETEGVSELNEKSS